MTQPARVDVITFGCRLNIVESEAMWRHAVAGGHRDLTIVNTCAVTAEATRQARQAIRRARRLNTGGRLVVTGCASEIDRDSFVTMPGVDAVVSNATKTQAPVWALAPDDPSGPPQATPTDIGLAPASTRTRGFVEIQNGCDHRCTFCVIPFGRGASRSVPISAIIERVRAMVDAGAQDVVLTGVDITSYGTDIEDGPSLGTLVKRLLKAIPDLPRLRLSSLDCIEADATLLDAIASEARLMPHLHLSLQSGSDLILKRMKRRHSRQDAIAFCASLRRLRPDIVFGADVIAGFPTETEAMFTETLDFVDACGVTHLHVFPFSARPNTPAARMPMVAAPVVRERAQRLRTIAQRRLDRHLAGYAGRRMLVLTERGGKGRTEDFTLVHLDQSAPGLFQPVKVTGHDGRALIGVADEA